MFELEKAIARWRQAMLSAGLEPEVLLELEEHVREDIERQVRSGTNPQEAFLTAIQRVGQPEVLQQEFALAGATGVFATLRRHRWKMIACLGVGVLAAFTLQVVHPAAYRSQAKLLIRIPLVAASSTVDEERTIPAIAADAPARIMNAQLELFASPLLAQRVAEAFGPERILNRLGGGDDHARATSVVQEGLSIRVLHGSSVIYVDFQHPDSAISKSVLKHVIDQFLRLHVETFRAAENHRVPLPQVSNITLVQSPSEPFLDSAKLIRMQALVVAVAALFGLGWIFVRRTQPALKLAR